MPLYRSTPWCCRATTIRKCPSCWSWSTTATKISKVLRGTKFYLVGEVDPSEFSTDERTEIRDRVFTQDYTTTLNMKVTGLEKAYNVVPNLLSPRLEMGVELVSKWVGTTPEEVLF